jgi:hypothetical protein
MSSAECKVLPFAPRQRGGNPKARLQLSPAGVGQALEMARCALAYASGRSVIDATERDAAASRIRQARIDLDFSAEIRVLDEMLSELCD